MLGLYICTIRFGIQGGGGGGEMFTFHLRLSEKSTVGVNGVGQSPDWLHWWCKQTNGQLVSYNFAFRNGSCQVVTQ